MIVLLPSSDTKRVGGDGPPLRLDSVATVARRAGTRVERRDLHLTVVVPT